MKVSELIERLKGMPQDADVVIKNIDYERGSSFWHIDTSIKTKDELQEEQDDGMSNDLTDCVVVIS